MKLNWQTIAVVALVAVVGYLVIAKPFSGGSGINIYILDKDMKPMEMIQPNSTYILFSTLGTITYNGKNVGGLGFSLWVKPTSNGTKGSGGVNISWIGYRDVVGTTHTGRQNSGTKNVPWDTATELVWDRYTDSWIQITSATFSVDVVNGTYTVNAYYDVTASGTVDGATKQATVNPAVSVSLVWYEGTLSIVAGVNITELTILR